MNKKLSVLDTTLRDGAQSAQVNFSVSDKLKAINVLSGLGFKFIEAGSPGISPVDAELFLRLAQCRPDNVNIVAFAPTARNATGEAILEKTAQYAFEYVSLFGKADVLQVKNVLAMTPEENLDMISRSVTFFGTRGNNVIFEAEHYFDGWRKSREYAIASLKAAIDAGAKRVVLCDTNGGMLPEQVEEAVLLTAEHIKVPIGIHCHNDAGLAVANTMAACRAGAVDVHGTFCGLGERCGNTNLCTVIPDLQLKLGYDVIAPEKLAELTRAARRIADITNTPFSERDPYVGRYAFSHKAGTHIDAEIKYPEAFQHIDPELVGNHTEYLVSNQSGRSAVVEKFSRLGINVAKNSDAVSKLLELIKKRESDGYQLENADGTVTLLALEALGKRKKFFDLLDFKIVLGNPIKKECPSSVLLKISVDGKSSLVADEGIGPVNAIDNALRKGLGEFYPSLSEMRLSDYRVRVIDSRSATAARVIVNIESHDSHRSWRTTGVSPDIIEASWNALCESVEYKLSADSGLI